MVILKLHEAIFVLLFHLSVMWCRELQVLSQPTAFCCFQLIVLPNCSWKKVVTTYGKGINVEK